MAQSRTEPNWKHIPATKQLPSHYIFEGEIEKPAVDSRDYRVIELENGLRAVLVHDPTADKAAACVSVHVGHLNDPIDVPGLAHFTEHMISKGTKQFPNFNELMQFITSNGGTRNASTGASGATYWFSIGPSLLREAVLRLSSTFHSPLFPAEVTAREIHAVDSENKRNLQDDSRRLFQLNKGLSAPGHPWIKFGTGNFSSLTEAARRKVEEESGTPSEEDEKADDGGPVGREVKRRMAEWREQEYCAGRMTFAIMGKETLDELTELTVREFSPVPNRDIDPRPLVNDYPWTADQQGCTVFVQTVKDLYRFELAFPIPYSMPHFRTRPANYLAHFLGHEGPGSICAYLKHKGWILSISAGPSTFNRGIELFAVSGKLTKSGYYNYKQVVEAIFKYILILKSSFPLPGYHFDEMKRISEIKFQYQEKVQAHTYAIHLSAQAAAPFPTQWVLNAKSVYRDWDSESVKAILDCFVPERARAIIQAKDHPEDIVGKDPGWETERWYGTQYCIQKFAAAFLTKLKAENHNKELFLPGPNQFVPTNLHVDKVDVAQPAPGPRCIHQSQLATLWYKKDDQFFVPKGDVRISLKTRLAYATPRHAVLTSLLVKLLDDSLSETTYDASIAGLGQWVTNHSEGLEIGVYGFNDKLSLLLDIVLEKVKNINILQDRLDVFVEELKRNYANFRMNKPIEHCDYYSDYLMTPLQWTPEEKGAELAAGISVEDIKQHQQVLLAKLKIECLVLGNFEEKEAFNILRLVESRLVCRALSASELPLSRSLLLPEGSNFVHPRQVYDVKELNSAIVVYHHFGDFANQPLRTKLALLNHIIREPAFTELRTNQQLGYIVSTSQWTRTGAMGLCVRIQSQRDPTYIEERIEAFMVSFETRLGEMTDEEFASQKEGLIIKKVERHKNIAEEGSSFWNRIRSGYYDFTRDLSDADVIRDLTKEDVLDAYKAYLHPGSAARRKLAVHLLSQKLETLLPSPMGIVRVNDVHDFKARLPCSPAARPTPEDFPFVQKSLL